MIGTNSGSPEAVTRQHDPTHDRFAKKSAGESAFPPRRLEERIKPLPKTFCPFAFISASPDDRHCFEITDLFYIRIEMKSITSMLHFCVLNVIY